MNRKKVFICGLSQESNSFNPVLSTLDHFGIRDMEASGLDPSRGAKEYFSDKNDIELLYGKDMSAYSGGPVANEVVEYFFEKNIKPLKNIPDLCGVILILHGATMSESCDDVCGHICEAVRQAVGEHVVISAAFDLHANITEKVAKNIDYICGFWEYPHIDRYNTGARAAALLYEHLSGKKMKTARASVPMMAPAHAYTTSRGALKNLNEKAQAMIKEGIIADYSVFQVQPWLDNCFVGSAVIVTAKDSQTAIDIANELALDNFNNRQELQGEPLFSVSEVIEKALQNKSGKPIVLVDSADSIGAGSTGDSAFVLEALLPYANVLRAATAIKDAPAVRKAFEVGVGNVAGFTLGSTISSKLSKPVEVEAMVRSLHDGWFYLHGPMYKGARVWTGKTAVLEIGKLLVRISEIGSNALDINYYESFGISLESCQLVAIKACTSFRAGYEPVAKEICNTNTVGAACPCILDLPYEKLPKPTYPFDEITEDDIYPAKIYR